MSGWNSFLNILADGLSGPQPKKPANAAAPAPSAPAAPSETPNGAADAKAEQQGSAQEAKADAQVTQPQVAQAHDAGAGENHAPAADEHKVADAAPAAEGDSTVQGEPEAQPATVGEQTAASPDSQQAEQSAHEAAGAGAGDVTAEDVPVTETSDAASSEHTAAAAEASESAEEAPAAQETDAKANGSAEEASGETDAKASGSGEETPVAEETDTKTSEVAQETEAKTGKADSVPEPVIAEPASTPAAAAADEASSAATTEHQEPAVQKEGGDVVAQDAAPDAVPAHHFISTMVSFNVPHFRQLPTLLAVPAAAAKVCSPLVRPSLRSSARWYAPLIAAEQFAHGLFGCTIDVTHRSLFSQCRPVSDRAGTRVRDAVRAAQATGPLIPLANGSKSARGLPGRAAGAKAAAERVAPRSGSRGQKTRFLLNAVVGEGVLREAGLSVEPIAVVRTLCGMRVTGAAAVVVVLSLSGRTRAAVALSVPTSDRRRVTPLQTGPAETTRASEAGGVAVVAITNVAGVLRRTAILPRYLLMIALCCRPLSLVYNQRDVSPCATLTLTLHFPTMSPALCRGNGAARVQDCRHSQEERGAAEPAKGMDAAILHCLGKRLFLCL